MIGNPFTYPTWDLLSMAELDSIPYSGVAFGEQLNTPGTWQGSIGLADPRVQALDWRDSSRTGRTLLCVEYNHQVAWGGIIWTRRYTDSSKTLQVGAAGFGSYFTKRIQTQDYSATWAAGTDPMVIARQVCQDAQAVQSIAGGFTFSLNPSTGSGQTVAASYPSTQLATIDSIVSALSQMGYGFGFDYSFDVAYLPGTRTPHVTMNFWYPQQGRSVSNIVVLNKNAMDFTYDEDSTLQAGSIFETGGGSGGVQPIELTSIPPGYPLMEAAFNRSDITSEQVLANTAFGDINQVVWPVTTPTLTLPIPTPNAAGEISNEPLTLGGFDLGDSLTFKIDKLAGGGHNTSPRFPDGMNYTFRIGKWTAQIPDKGVPTLLLDLVIPSSPTLPPPQPPL